MNVFNPISQNVRVYRHSDNGAPQLDRQQGSLQTVLKACLVTGYGDKDGANWQVIENTDDNTKAFYPAASVASQFGVFTQHDTGKTMVCQIYTHQKGFNPKDVPPLLASANPNQTYNTDIDRQNGSDKTDNIIFANLFTPFKYANGEHTDHGQYRRWLLLACDWGFWLWVEDAYRSVEWLNKGGVWLYAGKTQSDMMGKYAICLLHSGGYWDDGSHYNMLRHHNDSSGSSRPKLILDNHIVLPEVVSLFDGVRKAVNYDMTAQIYCIANGCAFGLPGILASGQGAKYTNLSQVGDYVVVGLDSYGEMSNFYFETKRWWF